MSQLNVGARMRNRETGEIVVVRAIAGEMVEYSNSEVDGEVRKDQLDADFEPLNDPSTREDIEAVLLSMYEDGEISTGLIETGLAYVAIRSGEDGKPIFDWYSDTQQFSDLLQGI